MLALISGLFVFVPFLGILTIILSRRGLALATQGAGRHRLARMAFILGMVNLALTLIGVVSLPPAVLQARRAAQQTQCLSNLRQLGVVGLTYASTNRGRLPANFDDYAAVAAVFTRPGTTAQLFTCPACANDPAKKPATVGTKMSSSYVFVLPNVPMTQIKNPSRHVLAYEPLSNHNGRGSAFLFLDGHCQWLATADATKAIAELQSGENPPPSIP
jgi:prepilin-type processing-associated H-X9-DG protein